jgi:hypothetical protein
MKSPQVDLSDYAPFIIRNEQNRSHDDNYNAYTL